MTSLTNLTNFSQLHSILSKYLTNFTQFQSDRSIPTISNPFRREIGQNDSILVKISTNFDQFQQIQRENWSKRVHLVEKSNQF